MAFMPYSFVKKILFVFNPETAHELSLKALNLLHKFNLIKFMFGKMVLKPVNVMGINFPNKVGLAAGLDKNAEYFHALSECGFGFVEVGTVTPLAQDGNDKPRLFRLEESAAIINRMGFNNKGVDNLLENITSSAFKGVLGINIGKNKNTAEENAVNDYLICLRKVYIHADYITINISSPNTPGLRNLQFGDSLDNLLRDLKFEQRSLTQQYDRYVPLVVKIAPDMTDDEVQSLAKTFIKLAVDGVIVSNTTLSREGVENQKNAEQQGGLSGEPLKKKADHVLKVLAIHLENKIPIIAVGGISSESDASTKIKLGASLVQIYTGFIYQGPNLIKKCAEKI